MKRILFTGAGGSPATNFIRSLKKAPEPFYFIGVDCDKFYLQRAEVDKKYLVPKAKEKDYIPVLKSLIKETRPDFLFSQVDMELEMISKYRDELGVKTFLPDPETIKICQNKFLSYQKWEQAGIKAPKTIMINDRSDLKRAFSEIGNKLWIREIKGAFGKGSLPVTTFKQAEIWVELNNGWGNYSAAECLDADSMVTWQSIWKDGELIVAQSRKRLYWEFGNRVLSGVTGLTGTGITVADDKVDGLAQKIIFAIDKKPHGIFSVDMTYDNQGVPNPTEINIGRFFTTHQFFTEAGLNMPYIFVKIAFGEDYPKPSRKINPLPSNLAWIRGLDFLPILTDMEKINSYERELEKRRTTL
ncbi:MAG: carboxylate--amine ligase [Candidatus Omnitrophica bacterium]|nr:carboxylate--amine ligase [Candidatus Omnitrophota bacterium]